MSLANPRSAYTQTQNLGGNPRSTEARALMEAARRLSDARQPVDHDPEAYRTANPLPPELKANIISLSVFVDRQTLSALSDPSAAKLNTLIDINRNIAAGLMTRPEGAPGPQPAPPKMAAGGGVAV
jgi:flagellar protein FlaF